VRTREVFRNALEQLSSYTPRQTDLPAFSYRLEQPHIHRALGEPLEDVIDVPPASGGATVAEALRRMASGELSAEALVADAYTAIAARGEELNAFTHVRPRAEAEAEAQILDGERRQGRIRGPLHGITLSVKDVIHVRGLPTSASSRVPDLDLQAEDASSVAHLRAAGAIVIGKTSTHEFALGVTTPQSRNPWDPARLPGGSSGGTAIAVATGMSLASLGTDTRASIRVPAALCGTVGFKATYGLIPTDGVLMLSWGLDHVAPMTKNVEDAALLLDVLARGASANGASDQSFSQALHRSVNGLRIGVPVHGMVDADATVVAAFNSATKVLRGMGVSVTVIDEPSEQDFALANAAGLIVSRSEAAAYHQPWLGRRDRYTDEVGEQLDEASRVTAVAYIQAQRWRREFSRRMLALFDRFDLLALPTTKIPAPFPAGSEELLLILSENCIPWSFIGFPAMSLPCGAAPGNLPIGLELVAAPYDDRLLLSLGSAYEHAARVSYV
jgi:aspartyl-tRNA(Asn)/glutamyl-tRNA(Gln) amidotransferase subunit A